MGLTSQIRRTSIDQDNRRASNEFVMFARCLLTAGASGLPGALETAKGWRAVDRVQEVLRAAVSAGTTTDPQWASALVPYQSIAAGFLESLRNVSAFQEMLSANGFRVAPFRSRLGTIVSGPAAYRVAELGLKPVSRLSLSGGQLDNEIKIVSIITISNELARFSGAIGATLFANELRGAVGLETDVQFFSELINTSTPSVPSSGNSAADAWSDLNFLFAAVQLTAQSAPYLIAGPLAARSFALRHTAGQSAFPDCGVNGGMVMGVPLLVSDGIAEDQIVLLDANRIVVADAGIVLDSSTQTSLALSDDGTGAPSSMWQQNATGLKCERIFSMAPQGDCVATVSSVGGS